MEGKFSVIIPTLLKSGHLSSLLNALQNSDMVDEILVIDNTGTYTSQHSKVRVLTKGKNIYVNPSWNWGVAEARNENICICNDDLTFDPKVLKFIALNIHKGIIGMSTDNYYIKEDREYKITPVKERCWGWGCCLFLQRSSYATIPDDLLIACGDDYLINNIPAFVIEGMKLFWTRVSTTSLASEFLPIQENDKKIFNTKYK